MLYILRVLGVINLTLTVYRVSTYPWGNGNDSEPGKCIVMKDYYMLTAIKILCVIYNTTRSLKIVWGIRIFFTLVLFIKKIRDCPSCYELMFIATVAELCIKTYLVQTGRIDSPGLIQFVIELVMVCVLVVILTGKSTNSHRYLKKNMKFYSLPV